MSDDLISFDIPGDQASIIKVIGVGGGGSNAVNHMYSRGIKDVSFVICNTDAQALVNSPIPTKIQLGESLTEGRGAGNKPPKGREAAIESLEAINGVLEGDTKMVFITAGMGGGTGTGAAPVIAAASREMGILTVGIVTIPFKFEGRTRIDQALEGIKEMEKHVDSLLIINNEKLREMYGDLKLSNAFSRADNVLATAAKGIAEIITVHGYINVDFADVETVMKDSGVSIMGSASADGEQRALDAIRNALESPLLNNNHIQGARNILLNITSGEDEITMDEVGEITDFVQEEVGKDASIIWGTGSDERLGKQVGVTIIATGFASRHILHTAPEKVKKPLTRFQMDEDGNVGDGPDPEEEPISLETSGDQEKPRVLDFDEMEREKARQIESLYGTVENEDEQAGKDSLSWAFDSGKDQAATLLQPGESSPFSSEELLDERMIDQIENIPAYRRRNVNIDNRNIRNRELAGQENKKVSRFSLSDGNDGPKLSDNNPFIHNNVD